MFAAIFAQSQRLQERRVSMIQRTLLALCLLIPPALAAAAMASAEPTSGAAITLMDVDGKPRQPLEIAAANHAAAIIFISSDCPICQGYAGEINRLATAYSAKGFAFYVVYVDDDLTADAARKQLKDYGITCAALLDPTLRLARKLHADVTPDAVIIGPEQAVLYHGRIDDLYGSLGQRRFEATQHDLRDALDAVAAGKPVATPQNPAIGCSIDYPQSPATQP
jgi:thiol-disulfide isomerase/thioredoxin